MWPQGTARQLRVELAGDEVRMSGLGQLQNLHDRLARMAAGEAQARGAQLLEVRRVHLVPVAETLADRRRIVEEERRQRARFELNVLGAQTHRAAQALDLLLLRQLRNYRVRALAVRLR